ncbi:MAG: DUF4159 domain-containing protein, partial [Candidatus Methylacidiphilales bacterium]
MHAPRPKQFLEKLADSQYFLIAGSLHLVLFAMIGSMVIFKAFIPTIQDSKVDIVIGDPPQNDPPPPVIPPVDPVEPSNQQSGGPAGSQLSSGPVSTFGYEGISSGPSILEPVISSQTFKQGSPAVSTNPTTTLQPGAGQGTNPGKASTTTSFDIRAPQIRDSIRIWSKNKDGRIGTSPADIQAKFVIHVARYANGDWNATLDIVDGMIRRGSIPNLLRLTKEWTKGRVDSETVPQPLDLASPELMEKRPPFVFFHGHKDFVLTDAEVDNLRRYLMAGGAVWADSCLAGKGSRFDIAFRREMKRVIPDEDKPFKPIPLTHDLFGGRMAFFQLGEVPVGMNYYAEPIEVICIDDLTAIIYTSNDYSDLMRIPLRPGTRTVDTRQGPDRIAVLPWHMWNNRGTLYRNFEAPSAEKSYQLGLNIISHLLLRFNDRLKTALPG